MDDKEFELIKIAESNDDDAANLAMKELREKYDATYKWCLDCDCAVVKEKDCCLHTKQYSDVNLERF